MMMNPHEIFLSNYSDWLESWVFVARCAQFWHLGQIVHWPLSWTPYPHSEHAMYLASLLNTSFNIFWRAAFCLSSIAVFFRSFIGILNCALLPAPPLLHTLRWATWYGYDCLMIIGRAMAYILMILSLVPPALEKMGPSCSGEDGLRFEVTMSLIWALPFNCFYPPWWRYNHRPSEPQVSV